VRELNSQACGVDAAFDDNAGVTAAEEAQRVRHTAFASTGRGRVRDAWKDTH
jgi:hypothetical protein